MKLLIVLIGLATTISAAADELACTLKLGRGYAVAYQDDRLRQTRVELKNYACEAYVTNNILYVSLYEPLLPLNQAAEQASGPVQNGLKLSLRNASCECGLM